MGEINHRGIHPCTGCYRPTRPKHSTREQYPGVVKRVGHGRCKPCYTRAHRPARPATPALDAYLAARRARTTNRRAA